MEHGATETPAHASGGMGQVPGSPSPVSFWGTWPAKRGNSISAWRSGPVPSYGDESSIAQPNRSRKSAKQPRQIQW